jgi:hypothetical protein
MDQKFDINECEWNDFMASAPLLDVFSLSAVTDQHQIPRLIGDTLSQEIVKQLEEVTNEDQQHHGCSACRVSLLGWSDEYETMMVAISQ